MSNGTEQWPEHGVRQSPDPDRIRTRGDFGRELTLALRRAGLTIRHVATALDLRPSTIGGYFSGAHLPARGSADVVERLVSACGITDRRTIARWQAAYLRLVHPGLDQLRPQDGEPAEDWAPGSDPPGEPTAADSTPPIPEPVPSGTASVSLAVPVWRQAHASVLRGRDELLGELTTRILGPAEPGQPRVHVLHGLGGCGKSALALAVGQRAANAGVRTWWIGAAGPGSVPAGMRALAAELGATVRQLEFASLPDLVWRLLTRLETPWLLVFDDVDDAAARLALPGNSVTDGTGWLRTAAGAGSVIVTTRDADPMVWGEGTVPWLRLWSTPVLPPADGALVLLDQCGSAAGGPVAAEALSAQLGGLPLALRLAGRYLAEASQIPAAMAGRHTATSFAAYQRIVAAGDLDPLAGQPPARPDTAARSEYAGLERTWELSLDQLRDRGLAAARPLLYLMAALGPSPVPYALVLGTPELTDSPLLRATTPVTLWRCLRGLAAMSLVELTRDERTGIDLLTLHPLVRATARRQPGFTAEARHHLSCIMAVLGALAGTADPKLPGEWDRWSVLAEHCAAPLELIDRLGSAEPAVGRAAVYLAGLAARYLRACGQLERAQNSYALAIGAARRLLEPDDPLLPALAHGLARVHYDRGQFNLAEQGFRRALAARRSRLGSEHPDTLTTQHYLARALRSRRRYQEAGRLFEQTLKARSRALGETHPQTLTSRNGVADLLRERGRLNQARPIYQTVLAQRGQVLGERHPATLVTRHYLAMTRFGLDQLDGLEAELRELIAINSEVRGAGHPRTLAVHQTLVELLRRLARVREAEATATELLDARTGLLGADHPATLRTRHCRALIMADLGRTGDAASELEAVIALSAEVLGAQHVGTVAARRDLAALRRAEPSP